MKKSVAEIEAAWAFRPGLPLRPLAALGRRVDARDPQHLLDGVGGDDVADVLQRTLDPVVAPRRALPRETDHEACDLLHQAGSGAGLGRERPLGGDTPSVPTQDGVGRDDRRHLGEEGAAEFGAANREALALDVGEQEPAFGEPGAKDAVLLPQVLDRRGLASVEPAGERERQQVDRSGVRVHQARRGSTRRERGVRRTSCAARAVTR
ncbi:MAG TPA: hypothetical protein VEI02_16825 [Planctomycetota bacterium]|nr:hypothetical protein [Planctomycetota bacterium]